VSVAGVGIDQLEIARIERAIERRPRLAERLFTPAERDYAQRRRRPGQHLAARFCAKEATAKALGLATWGWQDIEIVATDTAPRVVLRGAPAARARELGVDVTISLSHTRELAAAVAVAA
jgi:holo-[acyl-carrier protein] synthase